MSTEIKKNEKMQQFQPNSINMRDSNCNFAALFDKSIPLDYELPIGAIETLVENHNLEYPRGSEIIGVSKVKFKDYLKEVGTPTWEIDIFGTLKNVEGWFPPEIENLVTFFITQSIIPITPRHIIIITNATFLGIFPVCDISHSG